MDQKKTYESINPRLRELSANIENAPYVLGEQTLGYKAEACSSSQSSNCSSCKCRMSSAKDLSELV